MKFFEKKQEEENFDSFPPIGGLMVSKMVTDQNIKPRFMYREKRTRPEDSGWRIFTGFETDDYINDPNNTGIYNPSSILKVDPSLQSILLKGIGAVYERTDDDSEWYRVTDFELEDDYPVMHKLTNEWTLTINNLFERSIEDNGDLFYTTGDKSVRLAIWNEKGKSKEEIYHTHKQLIANRDQNFDQTLETFEFSDNRVLRTGYLVSEKDGEKEYGVVYGFSIIDNQVIQLALYFDEPEDIDWALETWKMIEPE